MKNNPFLRFLANPFTRLAGWEALGLGSVFAALSALVGAWSGVVFDGVLDMHLAPISLGDSFLLQAIDLVSLPVVMALLALTVTRRFRFIDLFGTLALARAPYFILAFSGFVTSSPDMGLLLSDPANFRLPAGFILVALLTVPFVVWAVALMFRAVKVSCNLAKPKLTVIFILGLLLAEILSKLLVSLIW